MGAAISYSDNIYAVKTHLFLGEEKYIINSKINRIIKETKADEFNITSYDCEETNVSNAIQDALTPPFMSDTKVVLIKRPLFLTNEKSPISHDLKLLKILCLNRVRRLNIER